jgi:hypothetical protein
MHPFTFNRDLKRVLTFNRRGPHPVCSRITSLRFSRHAVPVMNPALCRSVCTCQSYNTLTPYVDI